MSDFNYPGYISKEEKKIPLDDPTGKWSDLTLLPEWEEEFYDVYTVRKHGKWVMLKALKKEYADDAKYQEMLEKEFETRYNLAHPNIVMVNDFEDIPRLGKAIITDDVYGYSLRRLIDEKRLTPRIVKRLQTQLLDALDYIQENHIIHHPLTPESIIFTEYNENLKLINVGYDQTSSLSEQDTREDIESYGRILSEVLDNLPESLPRLRRIANKAVDKVRPYRSFMDLQLDMNKRSSVTLYLGVALLIALILVLVFLLIK
ncbi:MAG: protein kinase [Muribaculaceae bacterium]|nr:protein kinase [Muribaculaceae bacterium]